MTTATGKTIDVAVMSYDTGEWIGLHKISEANWELYRRGRHPAYQWPQGIARAGDVLDGIEMAPEIDHETTIWLEAE